MTLTSDKNVGLDMKSNAKGVVKELPTRVSVSSTNLHIQKDYLNL